MMDDLITTSKHQDLIYDIGMHRGEDSGREMVFWLARRHTGMTLGQLGERAGATDYAAVAMALRRSERKMEGDGELRAECKNWKDTC